MLDKLHDFFKASANTVQIAHELREKLHFVSASDPRYAGNPRFSSALCKAFGCLETWLLFSPCMGICQTTYVLLLQR